jgi:hypothetical protein
MIYLLLFSSFIVVIQRALALSIMPSLITDKIRNHKSIGSALHAGGVQGDATTGNNQIILGSTANNFLASAFAALDEREQYDTVLTGLCAKILDETATTSTNAQDPANKIAIDATLTPSQRAYEKLKDPISLLQEMNNRNISASARSLVALVDVRDGPRRFMLHLFPRVTTTIFFFLPLYSTFILGCKFNTRCTSHGNCTFSIHTKWTRIVLRLETSNHNTFSLLCQFTRSS